MQKPRRIVQNGACTQKQAFVYRLRDLLVFCRMDVAAGCFVFSPFSRSIFCFCLTFSVFSHACLNLRVFALLGICVYGPFYTRLVHSFAPFFFVKVLHFPHEYTMQRAHDPATRFISGICPSNRLFFAGHCCRTFITFDTIWEPHFL